MYSLTCYYYFFSLSLDMMITLNMICTSMNHYMVDHISRGKCFLFPDGHYLSISGHWAMTSPWLPWTSPHCFTFWHGGIGPQDQVTVEITDLSKSVVNRTQLSTSSTGSKPSGWHPKQMQLGGKAPVKVTF